MSKLNPKAVIFDLGSTLIEYESIPWPELSIHCAARAREVLLEKGFSLPDESNFYQSFEKVKEKHRQVATEKLIEWSIPQAAEDLLQSLNVNSDKNTVDLFFDGFYQPVHERLFVYDDTAETLNKIKNNNIKIGLISNTIFPAETHIGELNRFNIHSFFEFKIFSSSFKLRKPHPDIFKHAVKLSGFTPEECVYVGDRYYEDIEGPHGIGMPAVLKIKKDREYPDEMPLAKWKISKLSELCSIFDLK